MQNEQTSHYEEIPAEIVPPSALEALQRAETDIAIATAHRFPRKLHTVKQRMYEYATLDAETAESVNYYLRRKKKDGTYTEITGPSIRMAEIALACYGNITGGSRVIAVEDEMVTCQGVCHDLENNVRIAVEVKNRIVLNTSDGRQLAAAAGCAKALRNAVFTVIPRAIVKPVADAALSVVTGDQKTMTARRKDRMAEFRDLGVSEKEVLEYLGIESTEQIGVEQYRRLAGVLTSIREKETSVEAEFGMRTERAKVPAAAATPSSSPLKKEKKEEARPSNPVVPSPVSAEKEKPAKAEKNPAPVPEPLPTEEAHSNKSEPVPVKEKTVPATTAKPDNRMESEAMVHEIRHRLMEREIPEQAVIDWMDGLGVIKSRKVKLDEVNIKWLKMLLDKWEENIQKFAGGSSGEEGSNE
jgi:hypothetical protein